MADGTVYIGEGADEESVSAAVRTMREFADWDVEATDEYPGFAVAVDLYDASAAVVKQQARDLSVALAEQLPWPVATQEQLEQAARQTA